jgi:hypothetical protein
MFIENQVMDALSYLDTHGKPYEVVFSDEMFGLLMPAFSRKRVYYGHEIHTKDYVEKMHLVHSFFMGKLTKSQAQSLIGDNGIQYIFMSHIEKAYGGDISIYELPITEWYSNSDVTIYKVNEVK